MIRFLAVSLFLIFPHAFAMDAPPRHLEKIPLKHVFTKTLDTTGRLLKSSFSKNALPGWAVLVSTSAITYHYDEDIREGTQRHGREWGIGNGDNTRTVYRLGQLDLIRLPTDLGSAMYFLGDGWLFGAVAAGFLIDGKLTDANRPYNTGLQLLHGMIITGVIDQTIKRSTGRESPSDRSEPRGKWRPFTNTKTYSANTAKYDAMPSGHMMTCTLTFTIIRENYPEYESYLLPLQIGWLTVLGFQMVNNGVHWASDYPLGIAIGYMLGKSSAQLGQPKLATEQGSAWMFMPGKSISGESMLTALRTF